MKQMKNRKVMLGIIVLTAICGCRSVRTHESILKEQISGLDKLGNVMVITREDGSGTRSTFSQLTGFDEKNKEKYVSEREVIKSMRIQALFLLFSYNKHNTM